MANDFYYYDNDNDIDDNNSYKKMVALCIAGASLVVLIFLIILYMNTEKKNQKIREAEAAREAEVVESQDVFLENSHNFTSDELDFWKDVKDEDNSLTKKVLPKDDNEEEKNTAGRKKVVKEDAKESDDEEKTSEDADSEEEAEDSKDKEAVSPLKPEDVKRDNHISITDANGDTKYYEILSAVKKNDYDFEQYLTNKDGILEYKDNMRTAVLGIDLSRFNGDIDWTSVKASGVTFAMLRLGSRGYGTGEITLDDRFVDYAQNAALNNINIGAYFYSQAITEAEAVEEANYIVGAVAGFNVKYPIAIDIEKVKTDAARTDNLTVKERTNFVKLFCETVKNYGYKPVIYADMEMLVTGLDLEELDSYDIWLSDANVPTSFPYDFSMWQYTQKGRVNGITGDVDLDMSFIDYELR